MKRAFLLRIIAAVVISMTIPACATVLKNGPATESDRLAIGTIRLRAQNFLYYGDATVNGSHVAGIELTFRDLSNGEIVRAISQPRTGIFFFTIKPGRTYQLTEVYFKDEASNGAWADVTCAPTELVFASELHRVVNLGKLSWEADRSVQRYGSIAMQRQHEEVRAIVEERHPDSGWLSYDWTSIVLKRPEN